MPGSCRVKMADTKPPMSITRVRMEEITTLYNTDEESKAILKLAGEESWQGIYSGPLPPKHPDKGKWRYRMVWKRYI